MKKATKEQKAAIHCIKAAQGWDDAAYRAVLSSYHVDSSSDLTVKQASHFISHFSARHAPPKKSRYRGTGDGVRNGHLTQAQADEIARLEDALGWTENPKRLRGFIFRTIGKRCSVEMLMAYEASRVLTGLGKMAAGNEGDIPLPRQAEDLPSNGEG